VSSSTSQPLDLDVDRIGRAACTIDPVFRDSPQFVDTELCTSLGRNVLVKVEILNPLHSFKGHSGRRSAVSPWPPC
jgi:threonine dehydratase